MSDHTRTFVIEGTTTIQVRSVCRFVNIHYTVIHSSCKLILMQSKAISILLHIYIYRHLPIILKASKNVITIWLLFSFGKHTCNIVLQHSIDILPVLNWLCSSHTCLPAPSRISESWIRLVDPLYKCNYAGWIVEVI